MHRRDVDLLDPNRPCWIPTVIAPWRDWSAAPGCRAGERYIVNCQTLRVSRDEFEIFGSRLECLQWIMRHRVQLNRRLPGGCVKPAPLDRWLLGLA